MTDSGDSQREVFPYTLVQLNEWPDKIVPRTVGHYQTRDSVMARTHELNQKFKQITFLAMGPGFMRDERR